MRVARHYDYKIRFLYVILFIFQKHWHGRKYNEMFWRVASTKFAYLLDFFLEGFQIL